MAKRIVQSARCCGHIYMRRCLQWVYHTSAQARQWPGRPIVCSHCGEPLDWHGPGQKSLSLQYYYRRAQANLLAGRTVHGAPRRRVTLSAAERSEANRAKWHRISQRRVAAGLTTRGTERKNRPAYYSWRQFRSTLSV